MSVVFFSCFVYELAKNKHHRSRSLKLVLLNPAVSIVTREGMFCEEPYRRNLGSTDNSSKTLLTSGEVQLNIYLSI